MDFNITRQSIETCTQAYENTAELSVEATVTLPDYAGKISRVLKCIQIPTVSQKSVSGQTVTLQGSSSLFIMYLSEDGLYQSIIHYAPFSKSIDIGTDLSGCRVSVTAKSGCVNCNVINNSKVDISADVLLNITVTCIKQNEIASNIENAVQKFETIDCTVQKGFAEKYLMIDEEFSLPSGAQMAQGIIRYNCTPFVNDCKIIGNKAVTKGDLLLNAVYYDIDGKTERFTEKIPFSQIIEVGEQYDEECTATAKAEIAHADLHLQNAGEPQSGFFLNAKVGIEVSVYCEKEINVITDAFSTDYETETQMQNLSLKCKFSDFCETVMQKQSVQLGTDSIKKVLDYWCKISSYSVSFEDKMFVLNGTVTASFVICNNDGELYYTEKPVPFTFQKDFGDENNISWDIDAKILNCAYTVTDDCNADVSCEIVITGQTFENIDISVLTDILSNEQPKNEEDKSLLVLYYASNGDDIWNIAKKYNTSPDYIKQVNNLEDDVINGRKTLLIPCK